MPILPPIDHRCFETGFTLVPAAEDGRADVVPWFKIDGREVSADEFQAEYEGGAAKPDKDVESSS